MSGAMAWVRKNYGVPAKRGMRVEYTGDGKVELGTIKSASGGRLHILLDTVKHTMPFHPTWQLRYFAGCAFRREPITVATIKPPRDLRTQLPTEADNA